MKPVIDETTLRKLYVNEQKTDLEIAKLIGCHKLTIYKTRRRLGIKALSRCDRNLCEPSSEQWQVIYGTLLGDGSISNGKKGNYRCHSQLQIAHCLKQKDYVFWKYDYFKDWCKSSPKLTTNKDQWRIRTFHHPLFSDLRKMWYPKGKKIIPEPILEKLDTLGLAVWYMDDGSLGSTDFLKISTCGFSVRNQVVIKKIFNRVTYGNL